MCGSEFGREQARSACAGCPLGRGCTMICCPRCGYKMPGETRLARLSRWAGSLLRGRRNSEDGRAQRET